MAHGTTLEETYRDLRLAQLVLQEYRIIVHTDGYRIHKNLIKKDGIVGEFWGVKVAAVTWHMVPTLRSHIVPRDLRKGDCRDIGF